MRRFPSPVSFLNLSSSVSPVSPIPSFSVSSSPVSSSVFFSSVSSSVLFLSFVLFTLILSSSLVSAFGVSPGSIDFGTVNPGAYAEQSLLVSSVFADEWIVTVESDAVRVEVPEPFVIVKGSPQRIIISLRPEDNLAPGVYEGNVRFSFSRDARAEGEKQSRLLNAFSLPYSFVVSSDAHSSCVAAGLSLPVFEQGQDGVVQYRVKNTGTTMNRQVATLVLDGELYSWIDEVLPTQEAVLVHSFSHELAPGEYSGFFSIDACDFSQDISVSVVPSGSLHRDGKLSRLAVLEDAESVSLPVTATFENTGDVAVAARLSGVVLDANLKTVRVFEGQNVLVLPGRAVDFEEYIDGLGIGEFVVRAKVVYDGGVSPEREVVYSATIGGDDSGAGSGPRFKITPISFLLVVIPIILLLLILIRERRRR